MKTYTNCPSQRSGNQWVGFRLLTAIPEVPVGHNSGENRTSYHHCGGCALGLFQSPGMNRTRLCSRWQSSLSCLMETAVNWYHVAWKTPLFFPLSCTTQCPQESSDHFTWSDLTLTPTPRWLKWSQWWLRGEKYQWNMKKSWDFCIRSTLTELTKLMLNRLFP